MTYDPNVFGYVDGQPTYSRDEFIYKKRRRGPITDDAELVAFAEKVTSGWYNAGWHQTFTTYYLGDYALSEPLDSMTIKEYNRLKDLQKEARQEAEAAEAARCWQHDGGRCIVEVTVYRLNAVAVHTFLLDGPEPLLRHLGLSEADTYITKHDIDDLVTVARIIREEAPAWQH